MPLKLEHNLAALEVDEADSRVICCNHNHFYELLLGQLYSHELDAGYFLALGKLTCSVSALNLLNMLQFIGLRIVDMNYTIC